MILISNYDQNLDQNLSTCVDEKVMSADSRRDNFLPTASRHSCFLSTQVPGVPPETSSTLEVFQAFEAHFLIYY